MRRATTLGLFSIVGVISLLGLLFVFEASLSEALTTFDDQYHFVKLQGMWLTLGWISLVAASFIPTSLWKRTAPIWYVVGIVLLILVFIPGVGREFNGARRWITLGNITVLQPIEFVKFGVISFFAYWMSRGTDVVKLLAWSAAPLGLVLLQPDLGSTLLLFGIISGLYFVAGAELKIVVPTVLLGITVAAIAIVSSPYRLDRVRSYLNPELDPLGTSFHIRQITLALGRGGLIGQGIGNSQQKYQYIPETSSDSILAITAEELGFIGTFMILALYSLYTFLGYRVAAKLEPGSYEQLLGMGITIWISLQTLLNVAAIVALVPLTGMPLPFFSYGGSSLVMVLFATGVLIRLSKS